MSEVLDTLSDIYRKHAGAGGRLRPGDDVDSDGSAESSEDEGLRSAGSGGRGGGVRGRGTTGARTLTAEMDASDVVRLGRKWHSERQQARGSAAELAALKERMLRAEAGEAGEEEGAGAGGVGGGSVAEHLRALERQVAESRARSDELQRRYDDALSKLGESLRALEEKTEAQRSLASASEELRRKVSSLQAEREEILERSVARIRLSQEESETRQRELESRSSQLATLEDRNARLERDRSSLESRCSRLELELAAARRDAAAAAETETAREAIAMLRSQIQHLKLDNARLVRLVSSSKEYKSFVAASFTPGADASEGGGFGDGRLRSSFLAPVPRDGSAEYLGGPAGGRSGGAAPPAPPPPPPSSSTALVPAGAAGAARALGWGDVAELERKYAEELGMQEGGSDGEGESAAEARGRKGGKKQLVPGPGGWSAGGEPDARSEADLWVPTDVLRAAVAFRRRFLAHLPAGVVRDFLRRLNVAWRRRLHRQLARAKAKHDKELAEWKRRADQRQPYREVLQASTIHRLHTRLVEEKFGRSPSRSRLPLDVDQEASALGLTSEPASASASASAAKAPAAAYMRPRSAPRRRPATAAAPAPSAASVGDAAAAAAAAAAAGYGWDPAWTRDFPAAADGGGGHNAARTGWSTAKEHAVLLEKALETIDALRREVGLLKAQRGLTDADAPDALHPMQQQQQQQQQQLRASAADAKREGHAQGVAWLGRKLVRMADAMGEEVRRRCLALRRAAEGELTASQILALIAALEGEVIAYRSAARAIFEQGLEAGADPETYESIQLEVAGLIADHAAAEGHDHAPPHTADDDW